MIVPKAAAAWVIGCLDYIAKNDESSSFSATLKYSTDPAANSSPDHSGRGKTVVFSSWDLSKTARRQVTKQSNISAVTGEFITKL
ncbi:MAG: hypothetical protein ACREOZ_01445 [Gloeomargaritales cyanobacterium]